MKKRIETIEDKIFAAYPDLLTEEMEDTKSRMLMYTETHKEAYERLVALGVIRDINISNE